MTPCGIYSASKHALVAWAQLLNTELKRFRIRAHVICPGRVETEFFNHPSFIRRAPRAETRWTIPVEAVSEATMRAIRKNRLMTYIPRSYRLIDWAARAMPFVADPLLERLMSARIESFYALPKSSR